MAKCCIQRLLYGKVPIEAKRKEKVSTGCNANSYLYICRHGINTSLTYQSHWHTCMDELSISSCDHFHASKLFSHSVLLLQIKAQTYKFSSRASIPACSNNGSYFVLPVCNNPSWNLASTGRISVVFRCGCIVMFHQSWGYQMASYWIHETKMLRFNLQKIACSLRSHHLGPWLWWTVGHWLLEPWIHAEGVLEDSNRDDFPVWA